MANEAVLVVRYEDPIDFIVADGASITKGTILKLTDPRTAAANAGDEDIIAGIAARDKVANDGRTRLAVYRRGVFRLSTSGAITAGDAVSTKGANLIKASDATCVGSKTLGIALETSGGDAVETIEVELNIGCNNNAYV
jgi:hypothetical protein